MLRVRKHQRALDVGAAMAPARQLKMPLPNGADLFEDLEYVVAFHPAPCRCARQSAAEAAGRGSLKAQAKSVNEERR